MKTLDQLIAKSRIRAASVPLSMSISAVAQSTEGLAPGSVFFAIRGSKSDGHAYAAQALAGQAACAVVEDQAVFQALDKAVWVDSTREALGEAASRWYGEPTRAFKLVGVTGTNGKTTTTFLLKGIWKALGHSTGVVGTVEYQVGDKVLPAPLTTPDALTLQALFAQMRDEKVARAAIEVSSIALDQARVAGCRFEVGLFTNFTPDHLDYHGTMDAYLEAKRRLFRDYSPALSVFNLDDPAGPWLLEECPSVERITYAASGKPATFRVRNVEITGGGLSADVDSPQGVLRLRSPLLGQHNLANCLGVLAVQFALGEDLKASVEALRENSGAPGRLERTAAGEGRPYIFVDYAHTEDALSNVLQSLQKVRGRAPGRIITVFGCGGDRDRRKRPRMAAVAAKLSNLVVATSDNPRMEDPDQILDEVESGITFATAYHREVDRRAAIRWALAQANAGDYVLVAGKGHETYQILGEKKVPFDDREVIRDYYGV